MKKKIGIHIAMGVCAAVFLFSAGKIVWTLAEQYKEDKAFSDLAAKLSEVSGFSGEETDSSDVQNTSGAENGNTGEDGERDGSVAETATGTASAPKEKVAGKPRTVMETDAATGMLVPYLPFYEENPDFYGWICIDGTKVNYPVMYTPTDPEYYLRRAFDGSDARSGTPFLDASCTEEGNLYVVYGHRMKNRTMFGTLPYYEKRDYWAEHPYIYFDTLYEQGTYEIVAAFYSKIYE